MHGVGSLPPMSADGEGPIAGPLIPMIAARLGGNILIRAPFTFITAISRGLGIGVDTTAAILGARELGGLASPGLGHVADRGNERRTMVASAGVAGLTCLLVALGPALPVVVLLLVGGGVAKFGLDTAQSAWIAHRVPFRRRSRVFGIVECSWAVAFLAGIPVCAWLEERWGWEAIFVFCGVLLLGCAAAMQLVVPRDRPEVAGEQRRPRFNRDMGGMYAYVVLQPFSQMFVFAIYGDWFVEQLDMSTGVLAAATVFIGLGELVGTGATAVVTDRLGKRRSAIAGMAVAAPLAGLLGIVGDTAWLGVVLVVVMALGTEFSYVSALPIIAELDPDARAASIGLATAAMTVSRAVAAALAGTLYVRYGMAACGLVAAGGHVLGAVALHWVVEPGRGRPEAVEPLGR